MKTLYLFLFLIILASCKSSKILDFGKDINPPNCIEVEDNFYCDRTEISNIDWKEYCHWNKKIFGEHSLEYNSSLPDTNVWKHVRGYKHFVNEYYQSSQYDTYPVVGVSHKQASNYSKWRSDRVFEMFLIKNNIIQPNPKQDKNNYFTIKGYLNGHYSNHKPDKRILKYPEYSLPSQEEWKKIKSHFDHYYKNNCTDDNPIFLVSIEKY